MQIEFWAAARLEPYARDLKTHEKALPKMMEALLRWGFRVPLLVTGAGEIIDGKLRYLAAVQLGIQEIPVVVADDLTPTQVRTFRLLVNRSSTWADWNDEALRLEMAELRLELDDLRVTGFDDKELDALLLDATAAGEKDPDDVPELSDAPVCREGQLWELGMHRLMCGDATSPADVAALMSGERADMVWIDPPYNVDYSGRAGKIRNDKMCAADFEQFLARLMAGVNDVLTDGGAVYVAHSEAGDGLAFRTAFKQAGFKLSCCLIWRKNQIVMGRGDYHWQHEPILYGWKPTGRHAWYGNRKQRSLIEHFAGSLVQQVAEDVWQVVNGDSILRISGRNLVVEDLAGSILSEPKPRKSDLHPTMKPVALVERMVANSSPRGGLVADLCGGSGTTLIAAERLGRRCNMMECDPRYADVIIRRWQELTGKTAVLSDGGIPYPGQEAPHDAAE